jgi:predicted transcriptional regulator YdeE
MTKTFSDPSVKYCESAKFIGMRIETEFSKLESLSSDVMATIVSDKSFLSHLKTPFIQYLNTDRMKDGRISVVVGYIVDEVIETKSAFISGLLPAGQYVVYTVMGSYDLLLDANKHIQQWVKSQGLQFKTQAVSNGFDWAARYELYLIGRESEKDPDKWKTEIRYLLI